MKSVIKKMVNALGFELIRKPWGPRPLYPHQGSTPQVFYEVDEGFHSGYEEAQAKTQMDGSDNALRRQRHYVLTKLLRSNLCDRGDFCELGCWRGLSAHQTATFIETVHPKVRFHLFDSFEGLSGFSPMDQVPGRDLDEDVVKKHFACSLDKVRSNLREFDFISYYKGWVPDRFPDVSEKTFRWVHIDLDLYKPIKDSFLFFYPRLEPHGMMVFDDYGCMSFPGAKKAIDECVQGLKPKSFFFLPLVSGQAFLMKGVE